MEITGKIVHVSYYKKETGYSVVILKLISDTYNKLKSKYSFVENSITVVSVMNRQPFIEEQYKFSGEFVNDIRFGLQFKATSFTRLASNNSESLIQYFSSDLFVGIGIQKAKKIVETLGDNAIKIIKESKESLNSIQQLNEKDKETIYNTVITNEKNEDAFIFFLQNGLSLDIANKIISLFQNDSVSIVKENPYILMEKIDYFGFKKNDAFALNLGINKHSEIRLKALVKYILQDVIYETGNSYVLKNELLCSINKYLNLDALEIDEYNELIDSMQKNNEIINLDDRLFDYSLYYKEVNLAGMISNKLINGKVNYQDSEIDKAISETLEQINIELNDLQIEACKKAFKNPMLVITGGPGTGKTTIVKVILDMYVKLHKNSANALMSVALLAPTGKASKRLIEVTHVSAQTVHKYLGYNGDGHFEYGRYNKKDTKLVIIDEASMMDLPLTYHLFSSLNDDAQVIIVGDVDQLPSVGPGQILKDLIDSKELEVIKLKTIHRQAQNSKIIQLAHETNQGLLPDDFLEKYSDRIFIPTNTENSTTIITNWIMEAYKKGKTLEKNIQVLAPMYRADGGINELNQAIQEIYNKNKESIKYRGQTFKIGDKVIQLINRSEKNVMNGDIGIIYSFLYKNGEVTGLVVEFDFGKVTYTMDEIDELTLAYAITVHKSQGSEFDIVILSIIRSFHFMLKRKLIYTAITRAKNLLVIVGDANELVRGIGLIEKPRQTILKDLIIQNLKQNKNISIYDFEEKKIEVVIKKQDDGISPYTFLNEPNKKKETTSFTPVIGEEEIEI